jgi:putative restriction endonuclease
MHPVQALTCGLYRLVAIRAHLLAAYEGHCCITDCGVQPVLEAAHIVPYKG